LNCEEDSDYPLKSIITFTRNFNGGLKGVMGDLMRSTGVFKAMARDRVPLGFSRNPPTLLQISLTIAGIV
jgi:hypothetical protein